MSAAPIRITASNKLLEAFINHIPFGVIIADHSGNIRLVNSLTLEYLNIEKDVDDLIGGKLKDVVKHVPELNGFINSVNSEEARRFDVEVHTSGDKYFTISGQLVVEGYIITIEDKSKHKELEANSIQSILESQENERRRIGREIHDGIGPLLSYVKLNLDSFIDEIAARHPDTSTESLNAISDTIDSITDDLRSLSHRLVPRLLEEFGLRAAFENQIFRLNNAKKLAVNFYTNLNNNQRFEKDVELNLFRCSQELLNNVVKYAKATDVLVQLILHKDSIILMVEDDGIGFEKKDLLLKNYGIGLTNIDTRVRLLNGEFNLDSSPGKGTLASIEIPL